MAILCYRLVNICSLHLLMISSGLKPGGVMHSVICMCVCPKLVLHTTGLNIPTLFILIYVCSRTKWFIKKPILMILSLTADFSLLPTTWYCPQVINNCFSLVEKMVLQLWFEKVQSYFQHVCNYQSANALTATKWIFSGYSKTIVSNPGELVSCESCGVFG